MTEQLGVPLLIVDIDGTVRHGLHDHTLYPEAISAIEAWRGAGGRVVGVSNQVQVGLGMVDRVDMLAGMQAVQNTLNLDLLTVNTEADPLKRWLPRYPKAWMVAQSVARLEIRHPQECFPPWLALMVGDRDEDAAAARICGVRFLLAAAWRAMSPRRVMS